jgi:hypothetical protein
MFRQISAADLLVFAGAGVSKPEPAGLPVFDELRDAILIEIGLEEYVLAGEGSPLRKAATGLAAEPFMNELSAAGIDIEFWLANVLSGTAPNAAHHALAQLAAAGSTVWTGNFDVLIEEASGRTLRTVSWPREPLPDARLLKPHGSVGGRLIVTSRQVTRRLDDPWLRRLRSDAAGRIVLFIGYRGCDPDLQQVWPEVLRDAAAVYWFDRWAGGQMYQARYKRQLLRDVDAGGRLQLMPPAPLPPGVSPDARHNPCWDFIAWCQDRSLVRIDPDLVSRLYEQPSPQRLAPLQGNLLWAKPAIQGLLGNYRGARRSYWQLAARPGYQREAAYAIAASNVMHGGGVMAALLAPAQVLPRRGRLGRARTMAARAQLAAWSRSGRHRAVLRATRTLTADALSVQLILRSESLRVTGSLDEATAAATAARVRAAEERHPVRLAHAAFQECLALLWAGRLAEARRCLADYLRPYAELAANRWNAWADFIEGGLAVYSGHGRDALDAYSDAELRFKAEGLTDGVVSVLTARLAARRLLRDPAGYTRLLADVTALSRDGMNGTRYYTRRSDFTAASITNDHAEFARCSQQDLSTAWTLYQRTAASRYPLQQALGHLGLALIQAERGQFPGHAAAALRVAEDIGFRLAAARSRELLTGPLPVPPEALREVYFV